MLNWDNGLLALGTILIFSWFISESALDFLQKFGFKFDKLKKRSTLCFVFSIILFLTMLVRILYLLLFQW